MTLLYLKHKRIVIKMKYMCSYNNMLYKVLITFINILINNKLYYFEF